MGTEGIGPFRGHFLYMRGIPWVETGPGVGQASVSFRGGESIKW